MRVLLVLLAALVFVSNAATATFSYSVTTGSPVTVTGVTLNGVDQSKTFAIVSSVAYTGGNNSAGWKQPSAGRGSGDVSRVVGWGQPRCAFCYW